jgi:hypothetical protein
MQLPVAGASYLFLGVPFTGESNFIFSKMECFCISFILIIIRLHRPHDKACGKIQATASKNVDAA